MRPDIVDTMSETFFRTYYNSLLGRYVLVSSEKGVVCLLPEERAADKVSWWKRKSIKVQDDGDQNHEVISELDAYFAGRLFQFSVPLDLRGTDFQRRVWDFLCTIPYGETCSYGQVACAIGRPTASRAVGHANGCNPVAIIVPCHRVIGANGKLVGYGGGLDRKQALLDLEASGLSRLR